MRERERRGRSSLYICMLLLLLLLFFNVCMNTILHGEAGLLCVYLPRNGPIKYCARDLYRFLKYADNTTIILQPCAEVSMRKVRRRLELAVATR